MVKFWAFRLLMPVVGRFATLFYRLAEPAGWLMFHSNRRARANLLLNLEPVCTSDSKSKLAAIEAFRNAVRYYIDLASMGHRDLSRFEGEHLTLIHEERLLAVFEPGPTIVLSAHVGNPEFALLAVAARGRPFVELVEPIEHPKLAKYLRSLREAGGGTVAEANQAGLRTVLKTLRAGGLVAIMGDRDFEGAGVCVTMFDRTVRLPRGPWVLAQRTGARIVPIWLTRTNDADQTVDVGEPICVSRGNGAVEEAARGWASILEAHIASDPGQWTVLEDFWGVHGCGKG